VFPKSNYDLAVAYYFFVLRFEHTVDSIPFAKNLNQLVSSAFRLRLLTETDSSVFLVFKAGELELVERLKYFAEFSVSGL